MCLSPVLNIYDTWDLPKRVGLIKFYGRTAMVQEGDVRKTMAARDLVNGEEPTKWEGFSFPNVTLLTPSFCT